MTHNREPTIKNFTGCFGAPNCSSPSNLSAGQKFSNPGSTGKILYIGAQVSYDSSVPDATLSIPYTINISKP